MGKLILILGGLWLAACAERRYVADPGIREAAGEDCALRFRVSGNCLALHWDELPTETAYGRFILRIYDLADEDGFPKLVDLYSDPVVDLEMPAMNHDSPPVTVEKLEDGTYRVSNVFFIMAGEWEIRILVTDGGGATDEAVIPFTF